MDRVPCPAPHHLSSTQQPVGLFKLNLIIPLPKTFHGFPLSLESNPNSPLAVQDVAASVTCHPLPCLWSLATLASFRCLILSKHIPASGPLHLLFHLPGTLFPQSVTWPAPLHHSGSGSNVTFSERPSPTTLSIGVPLRCSLSHSYCPHIFQHLNISCYLLTCLFIAVSPLRLQCMLCKGMNLLVLFVV